MIPDILNLLIVERDRLTRAIEALGGGIVQRRHRGRPPKNVSAIGRSAVSVKKSHTVKTPPLNASGTAHWTQTEAYRKRQSARMKKYWAKQRASKAPRTAKTRAATA